MMKFIKNCQFVILQDIILNEVTEKGSKSYKLVKNVKDYFSSTNFSQDTKDNYLLISQSSKLLILLYY